MIDAAADQFFCVLCHCRFRSCCFCYCNQRRLIELLSSIADADDPAVADALLLLLMLLILNYDKSINAADGSFRSQVDQLVTSNFFKIKIYSHKKYSPRTSLCDRALYGMLIACEINNQFCPKRIVFLCR